MKKTVMKLPLYLLISGFIIRIVDRVVISLVMRITNEWTVKMGDIAFYLQLVFSLILFILIGIRLTKIYTRKTCFISASLVVIYSIIALLIGQILKYSGTYSILGYYMYMPIEIFTPLTSLVIRVTNPQSINWVYVIPSIFAPYLFLLFTKRKINDEITEQV